MSDQLARTFSTLVAVAAVLLATAASADAIQETSFDSAGTVSATLTWDAGDFSVASNAKLAVVRSGVSFDVSVSDVICDGCSLNPSDDAARVAVKDLDRDGEPEVLVIGHDHGASCCDLLGIYDFRAASGSYGELVTKLDTVSIDDFDHDGQTEIGTGDRRFVGLFTTAAHSHAPQMILRYERPAGQPKLVDVTRKFPAAIRLNILEEKVGLKDADNSVGENRSSIASIVAEDYLLGQGPTGLRELDKQIAKHRLGLPSRARAYRTRLLKVLHTFGYR